MSGTIDQAMSAMTYNESLVINEMRNIKYDLNIQMYDNIIKILASVWDDIKFHIPLIKYILCGYIDTNEKLEISINYLISHRLDEELNIREFEKLFL